MHKHILLWEYFTFILSSRIGWTPSDLKYCAATIHVYNKYHILNVKSLDDASFCKCMMDKDSPAMLPKREDLTRSFTLKGMGIPFIHRIRRSFLFDYIDLSVHTDIGMENEGKSEHEVPKLFLLPCATPEWSPTSSIGLRSLNEFDLMNAGTLPAEVSFVEEAGESPPHWRGDASLWTSMGLPGCRLPERILPGST